MNIYSTDKIYHLVPAFVLSVGLLKHFCYRLNFVNYHEMNSLKLRTP